MCACKPRVRTPNCGSMACTAAAFRAGEVHGLRRAHDWLRGWNDAAADYVERLIADRGAERKGET